MKIDLQYPVPMLRTTQSGIGTSGDKQTMFYVEVTDQMKKGPGGGNPKEGELIEVVEMSISEATSYMAQHEVQSPGGFMFALMWFFHNKVHI
uniref:Uncharacterized protein n=1 Tax=Timema genevievae TaxID=629358 RepID=A0A7R9PJP6_TIMGE|nr:unnamed protein product [Timema genevievae]